MALFSRKKNKKKVEKPTTGERQAARREQALRTGYVEHPEVQREYKRQKFLISNEGRIRAAFYLSIGLVFLIILIVIAVVIVRNIPGRDDDNDGVPNTEDVCPGFDDREDDDNDGVPNGCEEQPPNPDVDVLEATIVPTGQDRYDVAVLVENLNQDWGASPLEYTIHLVGANGSLINSSQRAESYLLPGQRKYLTAFNILAVQEPIKAELAVSFTEWLKVQNYEQPAFISQTVEYEEVDEPGVFARLKGKVTNQSTFTFDNVNVVILIKDTAGDLRAINQSQINTLQPGEDRDFVVTFPQEIPGVDLEFISYETDVDVFGNNTFVQVTVVKGQRFQQFTPQSEF